MALDWRRQRRSPHSARTSPSSVAARLGRALRRLASGPRPGGERRWRHSSPTSRRRPGNRIQPQQRPADGLGDAFLRAVSRSPEKGAETLVWLATSPDVANVSGVYFFDQEQRPPSPEAQDTKTAGRLWEISERQCAVSGRSAEARS